MTAEPRVMVGSIQEIWTETNLQNARTKRLHQNSPRAMGLLQNLKAATRCAVGFLPRFAVPAAARSSVESCSDGLTPATPLLPGAVPLQVETGTLPFDGHLS